MQIPGPRERDSRHRRFYFAGAMAALQPFRFAQQLSWRRDLEVSPEGGLVRPRGAQRACRITGRFQRLHEP